MHVYSYKKYSAHIIFKRAPLHPIPIYRCTRLRYYVVLYYMYIHALQLSRPLRTIKDLGSKNPLLILTAQSLQALSIVSCDKV